MKSIGETLRRERLRQNLELGQISQELKISSRMLAAIEDEKFDRLPGGVFSRSFVRQYAQLLGLNADEMASRAVEALEPAAEELPRYVEPVQQPSKPVRLPKLDRWNAGVRRFSWRSPVAALGMVVVAMFGCAGVYAWWLKGRHTASMRELPAVGVPMVRPAAQPRLPVSTGAAGGVSQASDQELNPNAAVRVELTAAEQVWVSVRSDGRSIFSGVLEANQSRTVDANATVTLVIGNAGGVTVLLNGKPIGSLGQRGQVRNVQLTSGGFEIVPPKPPEAVEPM